MVINTRFAILGLGEAGGTLAADLIRQGATVYGWDPEPRNIPAGVQFAANNPEAARQADVILSVNLSSVASEVAAEILPVLRSDQLFADLNTASPQTKQQIAKIVTPSGISFADVAIMAPILPKGIGTPTMASGVGAQKFHNLLTGYGMPVTVLQQPAGGAATRKLARSVFYKGVAAVVVECLETARRLDCEEWMREQMLTILPDEQLIDRFVMGSQVHAERRIQEMTAVTEMLQEIGVAPYTSQAAVQRLTEMLGEKVQHG